MLYNSLKIIFNYQISEKDLDLNSKSFQIFASASHAIYRIFLQISGENTEQYRQDSSSSHIFIPA